MNIKQLVAASILLIPVAATSLLAKPASAESYNRQYNNCDRSVVVRPVNYEQQNYNRRRVWVPGHWEYSYGGRHWVPGRYVYRQY